MNYTEKSSLYGEDCTLQTTANAGSERKNSSFWAEVTNLYNRVPLGMMHCKTQHDAQELTTLIICLSAFIFPPMLLLAAFTFHYSQKGGKA